MNKLKLYYIAMRWKLLLEFIGVCILSFVGVYFLNKPQEYIVLLPAAYIIYRIGHFEGYKEGIKDEDN